MNWLLKISFISTLLLQSNLTMSQTPCENGMAGDYPCNGVDLMSRITAQTLLAEELEGSWLNDIWGWTDAETGKEYALVGMTNGTSFVDVSDPINPLFLGILNEHNFAGKTAYQQHDGAKSIWRDIKVYKNHAFIVSEDQDHGMQVFDLTELRGVTTPQTFVETANYQGISNAHNIVINEASGFAYIVGATEASTGSVCAEGGLHILDISNPATPIYRACYDDDGYTHDAQCVIYNGPDEDYQGKEICFNANEDTITLVDVDDKDNIVEISRSGYSGAQYTHQGWLTEDHKYFLSNDELDEYRDGTNTKTLIWDVQDLDAPLLIGTYHHEGKAIDHNLYIAGDYAYESNYTTGLRILDVLDVADDSLKEVAYFDTYLSTDNPIFDGNWSNYPFFESGTIIISDITNGLFVLKMQQGLITHQPADINACVDEHLDIPMSIAGVGLSYQWQLDDGSGFKDIDDFERYKNTTTSIMHAHTLQAAQNGLKFRCIVTDEDGAEYITDTANLFVSAPPESIFTHAIAGNVVEFTNFSLRAGSYQWDFGDDSIINTEEHPVHAYDEVGEFTVKLTTTNDCTVHEITQTLNITTRHGVITQQPVDLIGCATQSIDIPMVISGLGMSYQWQIDDGTGFQNITESEVYVNTTTSVMQAQALEVEQSGLAFRCLASDDENNQYITDAAVLTVSVTPESIFSFTIDEQVVTFSNTSLDADSYQWDFGDQSAVSTEEDPIHIYELGAMYDVVLNSSNSCGTSQSSQSIDLLITGQPDAGAMTNAVLYPNPTSGLINLDFGKPTTHDVEVRLTSTNGKIIHQYFIPSGTRTYTVDSHSIECGMYYILLHSEQGNITKKVFIN
jgi:choice-of-anchor B domain-containing protein